MAQGILSNPPKLTRVSPGVYRDANGKTVQSQNGKTVDAKAKNNKDKAKNQAAPAPQGPQALPGLTEGQNSLINQRQGQDQQLGNMAGTALTNTQQDLSQPFDWNNQNYALPNSPDYSGVSQIPGGSDYNQWRQQQIDLSNQAFENRFAPVFKQQNDDFEQQMQNRGIPVGSDLYNKQKSALQQSQSDQRLQSQSAAMNQAANDASSFANVGFQAHNTGMQDVNTKYDAGVTAANNNLTRAQQARYGNLNEYNQLAGAQSGMGMQNLGYSQNYNMQQMQNANNAALQNDQQAHERWMMQNTPRGGGGGGGGAGPVWQQYGFSSPMEYDAYKTAQARDQQMWQWNNQPKAPSGPSTTSQVGGAILGTGLNLLGQYLLK